MTRLNLSSLRRRHVEEGRPLPVELEQALLADGRPGALAIVDAVAKRRRANRAEGQRLRTLLRFEQALWAEGLTLIAGIDEAGMSPLAGPVAAGAVVLPVGWRAPGINDSKQLDAKKREQLAVIIRRDAVASAVAMVESDEIDRVNIYWAGVLAMERAVAGLSPAPQHLLIDARRLAGCHQGRREELVHRRRVDPREDGAGRADGASRRVVSGVRVPAAQGLPGA